MRERELQAMDEAELNRRSTELARELEEAPAKLDQAYQELFNLRFRLATKQLDDTSQVRKARRAVARLRTAMSEMQREWVLIEMIRRERQDRGSESAV